MKFNADIFREIFLDFCFRIVKLQNYVNFHFRVALTLSCKMLLHKYPFDSQVCPIIMKSCKYSVLVVGVVFLSVVIYLEEVYTSYT